MGKWAFWVEIIRPQSLFFSSYINTTPWIQLPYTSVFTVFLLVLVGPQDTWGGPLRLFNTSILRWGAQKSFGSPAPYGQTFWKAALGPPEDIILKSLFPAVVLLPEFSLKNEMCPKSIQGPSVTPSLILSLGVRRAQSPFSGTYQHLIFSLFPPTPRRILFWGATLHEFNIQVQICIRCWWYK